MVASISARVLQWQTVSIDLDARTVSVAGRHVPTSPAEFSLLCLLLQRRNVPLDKAAIMAELFGPDHHRDERQADVFVARVRKALAAAGAGGMIQTIPGRGYALLNDGPVAASDTVFPGGHPVLLAA